MRVNFYRVTFYCFMRVTLYEGWLFIGSFKVGRVPGMKNKEVLAQFLYKPAQSTQKLFI